MYISKMKTRAPAPYTSRDAIFTAKVDAWQPLPRGFFGAFGRGGFDELSRRERGFDAERRTLMPRTF